MSKSVDDLLNDLRDNPADNAAATEDVLAKVFKHLTSAPEDSAGRVHWFCNQASQTTVGAASFLLRLYGFNGESVNIWKAGFHRCISNCCFCVQQLEEVKLSSRHTFFGAYGEDILQRFFEKFEEWELQLVLDDLKKAGFTVEDTEGKTLSDVSSTLLYRMAANWRIFSDAQIQALFYRCVPTRIVSDWPMKSPPPGLLVLLMAESKALREWARKQTLSCELGLLAPEQFTESYSQSLLAMAAVVNSPNYSSSGSLLLSNEPAIVWAAFGQMLKLVPVGNLVPTRAQTIDLRHIVSGHLHDTGSHFVDVLRSFLLLLKRLAQKFWANSDPAYPKIVFDSVKDNPAFLGLLQDLHKSNDNLWTLSWMPELLLTIQGEVAYGEVLAKMVDFLCEELQHERFDEARPIIMNSAIQLLGAVLRRCDSEKDWRHKDTLFNTLEIHSGSIVAVAFRRDHDTESWKNARISARSLVRTLLSTDVQRIHATISASCKALYLLKKEEGKPEQIPVLSIRKQLWTSIYSTIDSKDVGGLATVIVAVAKAATLAKLIKEPYRGIEKVPASDKGFVPGGKVIDQINDALESVQSGFLEAVSRFANFSLSTSALDVLRQPNVAQCIIQLLFSPVTDFQTSAQTLIGLAFDEDVRAEAIKAMFVNLPEATFDGIINFLTQFNLYAAQAPEACPLSRSLVRCFNDILEVLCSPPGGLLLDAAFLRPEDPKGPASRLLEFWKGLTTALTMIFKRTVMWSPYHKQKEMVEWMRDAVILGRDLIARWRVIENAANGQTQGKQAKQHSGLRGKMIACFQDMLPELSKWLRLTDEELLYQSFSILQSLLEVFKETKTKPHEETLGKLTKYIADARADGKAKSRLDPSSLSKLEDAMAPFLDDASDEEEVQIVDHVPATKKEKKAKIEVAPIFRKDVKEKGKQKVTVKKEEPPKRNYIQVVSKPTGKSAQSRLVPDTRKPSTSRLISDADKAKLETPAAFPTFKRSSTVATSSSTSTLKSVLPARPRKGEIKNEALAIDSDGTSGSSDSSDDEQQVGLSALGQLTKSPTIRKQERRQIKTLEIATGRSAIAERFKNRSKPAQHNPSLRLRPDISTLHKTILSWKYDHDGNLPPGNYLQLNQVPGDFTDYAHYRRIFEPLLLLECWAQIVRSKEETPDGHLAKVSAKEYVSDWLDLDLAFTDNPPRDWDLAAETDIVLLSSPETKKSVMAKTLNYKKSPMGCVVRARCFLPGGSDAGLMQGSTWKVSKIYSLSTINREYGALMAAPYIQCFDRIVSAKLERPPFIDSSDIQQAMETLKLNKPQATAVVTAMKTEGFVLIQGPPGTGKTSTICGLVSRFISHRPTPINAPDRNDTPPKAKVLICAPSNAAIDEIASRLMNATKAMNVVRIGGESSIGSAVKAISLDQLINNKIQTKTGLQGLSSGETDREIKALLVEMDSLKHQREDKLKELTNFQDTLQKRAVLEGEAQRLRMRRQELGNKLTALRDKIKSDNRSLDGLRRQMRREVLLEADVVCSTLSGAGHEVLIDQDFEMVIIDEAAQSIELSSLIPLKFNSARCVLVGDPQQLPPTVISQEATRRRYDQSLFFRLFNKNPQAIHLLSIQYRMHPDISRFPSQAFYEGRIEDGPDMAQLTSRPWHTQPMFGTYKFFNVSGVEEPGAFNSIKNTAEVQIAKAIYSRLSKEFQSAGFKRRIGIVSMYRAQISELKRQFFQAFGEGILESVDFNTVDGFQGQEKDIIILSCVRAGPGLHTIGFLSDVRRLNVAITRAKSALFVLGNAATLERSDETWKKVVADARERNRLVTVDTRFFAQPSTAISGVTSLSPTKPKGQPPPKKPRLSDSQPSHLAQLIPKDLVAPKDLKRLGRKPSGGTLTSVPSSSSIPPDLQLPRPRPPGPPPPRPVAGIKRPAEDDPGSRSGPSRQNGDGPQQPRPPPPKRPKQPQTMFIPKKPGKK